MRPRPFRRSLELLEDRTTPVTVSGLSPSLAGGTLPAATTSIQVNFSAAVVGGATASNFELRGVGADGLLGTADDVIVPLTPSYANGTTTLSFAPLPSLSAANVWRLTVRATITDTNNFALDGDNDGSPGGNFVRDFVGEPTPYLALNSPNGQPFDVQTGGFGAGQLLQGQADAFDGLNRLKVGGVDYAPPMPTVPGTTPVVNPIPSSRMVTGDDQYHDVNGHSVTFTADGSPVRLFSLLQVTNFGASGAATFYRLLLDGSPVGLERYVTLDTSYEQVTLEEVLLTLPAGQHTVQVQAKSPQPLRVDEGTEVAFIERAMPVYGPGPIPAVNEIGTSRMVTGDGAYHDVPGHSVSFISDGSPARVSAVLQATNFGASPAATFYRLVLDGTPVGLERYVTLGSGYAQVALEEVLSGLTPGSHTVQVQAKSPQSLRIDAGTEFVEQFPLIPRAGPGTEPVVNSINSSRMATADNLYHDIQGHSVSFTSDGSQANVSALLQVTNFGTGTAQFNFRLVLDGSPVGLGRYVNPPNTDYVQVRLDAILTGLSPGPHTVSVQVQTPLALRIDDGTEMVFQFHPFPNPATANGGRTVVTPSQVFSGLIVNREITVPATGSQDFARTVEVITNPTQNTVITPVQIVGNLGSTPAVFATQNGNLTVEPSDQWVGTDDADGSGAPAVIHYIHGPAGLRPSAVSVSGDNITWTFNVTLGPGQTVRLATFTVVGTTRAAAVAAAQALVGSAGFGGQAAAFLSPAQLQTVANFGFLAGLAFVQQPTSGQSGLAFSPPVAVRALDTFGNPMPDGTAVSLTAQGAGAALGGTTTATTVGGVASFAGLVRGGSGVNDTLTASSGGVSVVSAPYASVLISHILPAVVPAEIFGPHPNATADEAFIRGLYRIVLDRDAGTAEVAAYAQALAAGAVTRPQMVDNFWNSPENRARETVGYYQFFLGRDPSQAEIDFYVKALQGGVKEEQIVSNFLHSPESDSFPDDVYVQRLYQGALGRAPSDTEVAFYVNVLQTGKASRDDLVKSFLHSPESAALAAESFYLSYLRRAATPAEQDFYVNQIGAGALTYAGAAKAVLESPEFAEDSAAAVP